MTSPFGAFGSSPIVSVGADPAGAYGAPIRSGNWWPEIDPAAAMAALRIDGNVSAERLRAALVEGMVHAIEQLGQWKIDRLAEGHARLADVPAPEIDGESAHLARFRRAVYGYAAASLAEQYRATDATGAGAQRAELIEAPIEVLRRDARWAISDILGRPRTVVELI